MSLLLLEQASDISQSVDAETIFFVIHTMTRTVELVEVRTLTLLEPMGSDVVLGSMEKKMVSGPF
jgi:hypothetical protein